MIKEILEATDWEVDSDLRNAYYGATEGMNGLKDSLKDGNYKDMSKDFEKILKEFDKFDNKYGLGKKL